MAFKKGNPGGPGRPKKIVEDAQQSILLSVFDAEAERAVIEAQIDIAKTRGMGSTAAATWLWDRKYGKVKDKVEHSGDPDAPVTFNVIALDQLNYRNTIAPLAPRPMGDSEPPGED